MLKLYKMKKITFLFAILFAAGLSISRAQGTWTKKADFGGGSRESGIGFSIGSKGYIGTGKNQGGNYTKDFWEYDPATNAWTQKPI
jgi:N-acetylneuraminic acid mutarotase